MGLTALCMAEDALSDDIPNDAVQNPVSLPQPELGNLKEVEEQMRALSNTQAGRDGLTTFIISIDCAIS
jgi:protein phosphatase-4 regulatory subunit 3